MPTTKTATWTFHIDLAVKEALRTAGARAHRAIANMVWVLVWGFCGRKSIVIEDPKESKSWRTSNPYCTQRR